MEVKFKVEKEVAILSPYLGKQEEVIGLPLCAWKIFRLYKGDRVLKEEGKIKKIVEGFERAGYIKLRSFERITFATGISFKGLPVSPGIKFELHISPESDIEEKQGLLILHQIYSEKDDEEGDIREQNITFTVINNTPYLNTVYKNELLACIYPKLVPEITIKLEKV